MPSQLTLWNVTALTSRSYVAWSGVVAAADEQAAQDIAISQHIPARCIFSALTVRPLGVAAAE